LIEVEIEDAAWTSALPEAEALTRGAAEAVLAYEHLADRGATLLLTGDLAVQALNARFRGQDKPTNVLSFPAPPNPESHLGDVALAFETCAREAAEQGKPLAHHLQHLVAHGVLHLLGYDHLSDPEAEEMEGLERTVLASLGVPDPYAADD
jgi:probable rRNA maturation factor